MIRNYFKVAVRSILKNKISSIVSIIGLSISMLVGVIIFAYLKNNWETDHFHPSIENTYRITTQTKTGTGTLRWATCPQPVAEELNDLSYVDKVTTVRQGGNVKILAQKREIPVEITFIEPSFFDVFGFRIEKGSSKGFFAGKNKVIVSQEIAKRLFGDSNPIGKTMTIDGWGVFEVAGIMEKPGFRSHIPVEIIVSMDVARLLETKGVLASTSQDWSNYKTTSVYVLTNSETDLIRLNTVLAEIAQERKSKDNEYFFTGQNLEDITPWDPAIQNDFHAGSNWTGIVTWVFLALAVTLLAAFNYTALSVARIFSRAREVGIRKSNGALGKQIFYQFIIESVLLSCSSLVIAYLAIIIIDASAWVSLTKELNLFPDFRLVGLLLCYTILTGFVAGAIPAFILSKFKPIDVLKSLRTIGVVQRVGIYKAILIVQFSVTIMLTIFFVVLRDMGLNVQNRLVSKLPENITVIDLKAQEAGRLSESLAQIGQVQKVALSDHLPVMNPVEKCSVKILGKPDVFLMGSGFIDRNYVDVFKLKLIAGTNLPENQSQHLDQHVLVNEAAGKMLLNGNKEVDNLIGKIVTVDSVAVQIAGVVADESFHAQYIVPALFRLNPSKARFISLQGVEGAGEKVSILSEMSWRKNFPDLIPEIYDYKKRNLSEYKTEMSQVNLSFGLVCGIVLFVSCLGIFGMANYAVSANRIQLGIRRTFGANSLQLVISVTKPFMKILALSGVLGVPMGLLCGNLLTERFGLHVDLGIRNVSLGYALVVVVALIVVISQTLKSAYVNPVKVLRSE
jgi:putative ABC transport system permease protein